MFSIVNPVGRVRGVGPTRAEIPVKPGPVSWEAFGFDFPPDEATVVIFGFGATWPSQETAKHGDMPEVSESHGCSSVDAENADAWKRSNTAHEETVNRNGCQSIIILRKQNWFLKASTVLMNL